MVNLPPGPEENLGSDVFRRENPLDLFPRLVRDHGNIVHARLGDHEMVILNEPDLIEQVLRRDHALLVKGSLWWIKAVMGNGVGVSEGQEHRRQRKMMAPPFSPRAVTSFSAETARICLQHSNRWSSGTLNVLDVIGELTLEVVCATLFGFSANHQEVQNMRKALGALKVSGRLVAVTEADVPSDVLADFKVALAHLDAALHKLVTERDEASGNDIITHLIALKDDEQKGFDERELRDHAMALMLAGHDSTADAICWALYLLAEHPDCQEKAWAEADRLPNDPGEQKPDALVYGRQVFAEAMRLYPPSWVVSRQTTDFYELGPYTLSPQTYVRMCQWVTHRDARFFPDPHRFDPERWKPESQQSRPKFSYYPFGGGDRICLGQAKAWMEGPLIVANILKKWRVEFVEKAEPIAAVVLSAPSMVLNFQPR